MLSIREKNTIMLLRTIFFNKNISRSEISIQTKLNKASVSEIIKALLDENIIIEKGSGDSSEVGGRRPIKLAINPQYGVAIGVDVGVHTICVKVMNLEQSVIYEKKFSHTERLVEDIELELNKIKTKAQKVNKKVLGMTLSIQGMVSDNQIIFTPNYNIIDLESIKGKFDFPIYIENEANLAAFAHGQHCKNPDKITAAITMRTGIGSGLMLERKIFRGLNGGAGEIGHTIIFPKGRKCPCGNKGCLEQYASEKAVISDINDKIKHSGIEVNSVSDFRNIDSKIVIEVLEETAEFLAICTNNLINTYSPSHIYFSGRLFDEYPEIIDLIHNRLESVFSRNTQLLISEFKAEAPVIGACHYTIHNFIEHYK